MLNLKINPEFKAKIPPLTDDEFNRLEENILSEREIREPITVWNGTIIDGHNRYAIWQAHKDELPEPKIHEMKFADKWEAIEWIIGNQLCRRNITSETVRNNLISEQQKAKKSRDLIAKQQKDKKRRDTKESSTPNCRPIAVSPQQAAEMLGLSRVQIYNLMRENQLASFHIGRSRRISMCEIERFVAKQEKLANVNE